MEIPKEGMLPIGTLLCQGKYRIEKYLSSGGFGNTYLATNTIFKEKIAIKEHYIRTICSRKNDSRTVSVTVSDNVSLFEAQRKKFSKEALRIHGISNEHIVCVHDLFDENSTSYYVMDFIDGESLSARMKRTGKALTESEVLRVVYQVLDALQVVHSNGLLHLDLKPGNIMMDAKGDVKLIDFGASKQVKDADGHTLSMTSGIAYTLGYAPTEQTENRTDSFGAWTDLYSLGATIYNLVTKTPPPSSSEIIEDAEAAFSFPANVSTKLRKLIVWLMSPNRHKRPQNVDDVIAFLNKNGVSAGSNRNLKPQTVQKPKDIEVVSVVEKPVKPKSSVWKYVLAALVCFALIGGGVALFYGDSGEVIEDDEFDMLDEDSAKYAVEEIAEDAPSSSNELDGYGNGHEYVDLGLSVKWATCNVGADSPEGYGNYYSWGETTPKGVYDWQNLKYCLDSDGDKFSKYVTKSKYGIVDNNTTLDLSDDAANVNWGGSWRMPTSEEWDELREKCNWVWTTLNGIRGYEVTSKSNGYSLFLPAAGYRFTRHLIRVGSWGRYWSSSLSSDDSYNAYYLHFESSDVYASGYGRDLGFAVRPVCK